MTIRAIQTDLSLRSMLRWMIVASLFCKGVATGQDYPVYPPLREGINAAVATLNVDALMLKQGAEIFNAECSQLVK